MPYVDDNDTSPYAQGFRDGIRKAADDREAELKFRQWFNNAINRLSQAGSDTLDTLTGLLPGLGGTLAPSQSPVWNGYDTYRDNIKTSGTGSDKQYYRWDRTHGHIETYNSRGEHIGVTDSTTGVLDKSKAVPGRRINL